MGRTPKLILSLATVSLVAAVVGIGTYSAFSSTTENTGNAFAAGTVYVSDSDSGSAFYGVTNQKPGDTVSGCILLTYTGTLPATVKLYTTSTIGALGPYLDLTVEKGTFGGAPTFPDCTGFTAEATLYSDTLAQFAADAGSYDNGLASFPGAQTQWDENDTLAYRFTLALQDDNGANGGASPLGTGAHAFTWEARNQ